MLDGRVEGQFHLFLCLTTWMVVNAFGFEGDKVVPERADELSSGEIVHVLRHHPEKAR